MPGLGDLFKKAVKVIKNTAKDIAAIPEKVANLTKDPIEVSLQVEIENHWGASLKDLSLSHSSARKFVDRITLPELAQGARTAAFKARFMIYGTSHALDYWILKFNFDEKIWTCKVNFSADLSALDYEHGGAVICRIEKDGGSPQMKIIPPSSSYSTVSLHEYPLPERNARPVYAIAHKCNDQYDVVQAIHRGFNAIECDLKYDKKSEIMYVNHDDASGMSLEKWLDDTKEVMDSHPTDFALIFFDCKFVADLGGDKSKKVLAQTREIVRGKLARGASPINYIFSVSDYKNRSAFDDIFADLRGNEGIAIDESSEPDDVEAFFKEKKCRNAWYGNGIFVAGVKSVAPSIKRGAELRDKNGLIKGVYVWTLNKESSIREYFIDYKVNGVFANPVGLFNGSGRELHVIYGERSLRFARREDNPFISHK
jgi:hypothetical protein